jgi:hypothetical protein
VEKQIPDESAARLSGMTADIRAEGAIAFFSVAVENQTRRGGYRGGLDDQSIQSGRFLPETPETSRLERPFMSLASRRKRQFFSPVNVACRRQRHIYHPIKHNAVNLGRRGQFKRP